MERTLTQITTQEEFNQFVVSALTNLYLCAATVGGAEAYHDEKFRDELASLTAFVTGPDEYDEPIDLERLYASEK